MTQANKSSIDAGVSHVRDEILPAVMRLDGCVGLSMAVDRDSGWCVVTTSWRDEAALRASREEVKPMRARAMEILGGSDEVDEWEIGLMHRDHPTHDGACARITWLQGEPSGMDKAIETFKTVALPQLEGLAGFCSASFMVNRTTGRLVSTVCYKDRASLQASLERNNQIRAEGTQRAGVQVIQVREFELAVAHLRVPELV